MVDLQLTFDPDPASLPVDFRLMQCPECCHDLIVIPSQIGLLFPTPQHFRCSLCFHDFDNDQQFPVILMKD
jgi:hypothetical protein